MCRAHAADCPPGPSACSTLSDHTPETAAPHPRSLPATQPPGAAMALQFIEKVDLRGEGDLDAIRGLLAAALAQVRARDSQGRCPTAGSPPAPRAPLTAPGPPPRRRGMRARC